MLTCKARSQVYPKLTESSAFWFQLHTCQEQMAEGTEGHTSILGPVTQSRLSLPHPLTLAHLASPGLQLTICRALGVGVLALPGTL